MMHDRLNVPLDLLHLVEKRSGKDRRKSAEEMQVDAGSDRADADAAQDAAQDGASDNDLPEQSTGSMNVERRTTKRRKSD